MSTLAHGDITREIIGAGCEIWKVLGYGFLQKVYEKALVAELSQRGIQPNP